MGRMLARVESATRARLDAAEASYRVAQWVAGAGTPEGRARRAEVAIYARQRLRTEGWPARWVLVLLSRTDAAAWFERRRRGLPRQSLETTCGPVEIPKTPPPPTRATKLQREEALSATVAAELKRLLAIVERRPKEATP